MKELVTRADVKRNSWKPYKPFRCEKTGVEIILAEVVPIGEQFSSAKLLASWAGLCPDSYESGGIKKSAHILTRNKYLKTILFQCGRTAGRSNNPIFLEFYDPFRTK